MTKIRLLLSAACALPLALIAAEGARAQQAAPAPATPATPDVAQLQEVIVTAERRSVDVQRTPIAIQAVTGENLTQANVTKPTGLVKLVPGLAVSRGFGGLNNIYVRGIGAQIINAFGDMAVAQSVDGVYIARGTALSGAFLDLQRSPWRCR